ncbi:MAG: restriction endonuclease [Deltaproteobacteria bacterium]
MTRSRREESPFEELASLFEQLPLRVGLITALVLALIGWFVPMLAPSQGLSGSFALMGRYVVWLLAFMIGVSALVGAARRFGDRTRFDSAAIEDLTWSQFEGYLAEYYRRRGATVTYRGGSSADGGVDLVVDDAAGRRILQAKHWKTWSVGVRPVRELWGVRDHEHAQGAIFVTAGVFTSDARAFAVGKSLELIDGAALRRLVAEVKAAGNVPASSANAPGSPPHAPAVEERCPRCGDGVLIRRLAKRGARAGSFFLGCSHYPQCNYTRDA